MASDLPMVGGSFEVADDEIDRSWEELLYNLDSGALDLETADELPDDEIERSWEEDLLSDLQAPS